MGSAAPPRAGAAWTDRQRPSGSPRSRCYAFTSSYRALTALNSRSYWRKLRGNRPLMCRGRKLVTFLQLTLNGLAVGCIYGLVALGFVLIYKATELVNFAQGDLLMLGAFVAYMAVVWWGLDYWLAFAIAVVTIGALGALLDKVVLRQVIDQPQFAVVMLTIGLGAMFRTFASVTWGSEIYTLPTPFGGVTTVAGVTLSHQYLSIIAGPPTAC